MAQKSKVNDLHLRYLRKRLLIAGSILTSWPHKRPVLNAPGAGNK